MVGDIKLSRNNAFDKEYKEMAPGHYKESSHALADWTIDKYISTFLYRLFYILIGKSLFLTGAHELWNVFFNQIV